MVWYASDWGPSCLSNIMGCWRTWNRPRHYVEKILGEKTPQFEALLAVLELKMQQYCSKRAALSEFEAVKQMENENLKDYFRRVRFLGDLALSEKSFTEKDQDLPDHFLEGLFDLRLQQKLYEDETDGSFCEVLYRAQVLEPIQKSSEQRRRPLLYLFRDVKLTKQG